ncbi:MAG: SixA phosphatase family protein [Acidimicrobiales bacterium]
MAPRTLLLLRHAKSDWTPSDPNDHDRPLAKRGRNAARGVAELIPPDEDPELILCSSARRAIETLAGVSSLFKHGAQVSIEHGLYGADEEALLARLHAVPPETASVMVIAHNPGLHDLAIRVTGKGDPEVVEALAEHLAAGGLVSLSLEDGTWADLGTGSARLARYEVPGG